MRSWNTQNIQSNMNHLTRVRNLPMRSWNIRQATEIARREASSQFTNEELKPKILRSFVKIVMGFAIYQWGVETAFKLCLHLMWLLVRNLPMGSWNFFLFYCLNLLSSMFAIYQWGVEIAFLSLFLIEASRSQFTNEELKRLKINLIKNLAQGFAIYQWGVETSD